MKVKILYKKYDETGIPEFEQLPFIKLYKIKNISLENLVILVEDTDLSMLDSF